MLPVVCNVLSCKIYISSCFLMCLDAPLDNYSVNGIILDIHPCNRDTSYLSHRLVLIFLSLLYCIHACYKLIIMLIMNNQQEKGPRLLKVSYDRLGLVINISRNYETYNYEGSFGSTIGYFCGSLWGYFPRFPLFFKDFSFLVFQHDWCNSGIISQCKTVIFHTFPAKNS